MSSPGHNWLPTNPGQSIAVYGLTLLLMLNTTVLLLVIRGDLSTRGAEGFLRTPAVMVADHEAVVEADAIELRSDPTLLATPRSSEWITPADPISGRVDRPRVFDSYELQPIEAQVGQPTAVVEASESEDELEPEAPPATFFGVEIR